jgi:glycosyltransferase involved in cell wall biosynthesis
LKVLFPFVGDSIGGSHHSTLLLIQNLDKNKYTTKIILHKKGVLSNWLESRGIEYDYFPINKLPGEVAKYYDIAIRLVSVLPKLFYYLIRSNSDIVHGNDLRINLLWSIAAKLCNKYYVWHQRVVLSDSKIWYLALFFSSHIVAISFTVKATIPAINKKVSVVYNPFETVTQRSNQVIEFPLYCDLPSRFKKHIVGFIGRIDYQKRPEFFVEVAKTIYSRLGDNVHFVMLGSGSNDATTSLIKYIESMQMTQQVTICGYKDNIIEYLRCFDVLLATGVNEGFGRTLVEAMFCKVPVVAANSGGHAEIINHDVNGYLVPPDDVEMFADAVINIFIDESKNNKIVDVAYNEVVSKFTINNHLRKMCEIYDEQN